MAQEQLLDDLDQAVDMIAARYRLAALNIDRARTIAATCRESLYAAMRRRQAVRVAGEVDAPVPCRDCLTEVGVDSTGGAGGHTDGSVHHELVYEPGELPYATCGRTG